MAHSTGQDHLLGNPWADNRSEPPTLSPNLGGQEGMVQSKQTQTSNEVFLFLQGTDSGTA